MGFDNKRSLHFLSQATDAFSLIGLVSNFPNDKKELFDFLCHADNFQRLITKAVPDLSIVLLSFPEYEQKLIQFLCDSDSKEIKRLVTETAELESLGKVFHRYKDQLFQAVLDSREQFDKIVTTEIDVSKLVYAYPQQKEKLFSFVCDPEKLPKIVKSMEQFSDLLKHFSNHNEELFRLASNTDVFKRIIKNTNDLQTLKFSFRNKYAFVFEGNSVEKALEEISKISKQHAAYSRGAVFGMFPNKPELMTRDITNKISDFLGPKVSTQVARTSKTAVKAAADEFERESNKSKKPGIK